MLGSRRRFLKYAAAGTGIAAGGASWWLTFSKQAAARWTRRLMADARRTIRPSPTKPNPNAWSDNRITVCWLGHATVLVNFYGVRILTDPVLGKRIGISLGLGTAGPKRHIAPALTFAELPPIDLLLLSHGHMDHMDLPSLRQFARHTPVVTAAQTSDILSKARLQNVTELRWGDRVQFGAKAGRVEIRALEVKHWGARWPSEMPRGYNGYLLKREGKAILFGGDTALTPLFSDLRSHGPFELAMMPIGAYQPWIWNHCNPEQALAMANAARGRYIVPIHHQTFRLSDEPFHEPIERLADALSSEPERLALRRQGQTFVVPDT